MTDTLRDRLGALPTEEIARMLTAAIVMAEMGEIPAKVTVSQWRAALVAQPAPAVMGNERDTLIDHYYQDQGVTPEGELRPLVSKLLKRVERAEARTAAAESREEPDLRQALRKYIDEIRKDWPITDDMDHVYAHVASQTNAILDDLEERLAAAPQPGESQ